MAFFGFCTQVCAKICITAAQSLPKWFGTDGDKRRHSLRPEPKTTENWRLKMKTLAIAIATTALTATVASAASVGDFDRNGDRFASFGEVVAANATIDRNDFRSIDVNRDNRLSSAEIQAAGAQTILKRGVDASPSVRDTRSIAQGSFVTQSELMAAYAGLSSVDFDLIDTNNDNRVGANELYASGAQDLLSQHEAGSQILVSLDSIDTDGSGFASLAELQAQYPGLSAADLIWFDANDDNRVSFTELYSIDAVQVLGKNR
ncbi:MAG: hypothetical protein KJO42_15780 [Silicimonas sp.]|nr:hypothetical protein [Silicimonas sp.]